MGSQLGLMFARAGHRVTFSYSRSYKKLQKLSELAGAHADWAVPEKAIAGSDVVILAVPWEKLNDILTLTGLLSGRTVISCMVPIDLKHSPQFYRFQGSGSEFIAQKLPECPLVSAFQTTPGEMLESILNSDNSCSSVKPSVIFCSNNPEASILATELIADIGFSPVDGGQLKLARYTESFARSNWLTSPANAF